MNNLSLYADQSVQYQDEFVNPFIESNTIPVDLNEIMSEHIVPVFTKDNIPLISQGQIINTTQDILNSINGLQLSRPEIRCSHPIKGRIPSAMHKQAKNLLPHEKTLYYERVMFVTRVLNMVKHVNGQKLNLVVGGVKAFNRDNINKTHSAQSLKLFVGFQVKVCSNLCVWTDGSCLDLSILNKSDIEKGLYDLIQSFNPEQAISNMTNLQNYSLSESQFAQLIGRCRIYNHLSPNKKRNLPSLRISDSQISTVTKQYYRDANFGSVNGEITLWNLYNLFTDAVKSSYIDTFIDRNVNAFSFTNMIKDCLDNKSSNWFLN